VPEAEKEDTGDLTWPMLIRRITTITS